ncbi:hypothetical protein CAPTEDRAFT_198178 [Capitella teleta]|uniref:Riboflavin transporter n=1 Tax=Capitella teleta TaxID=283909 RepID=X1ZYC8_CAPTE|nr:hypothetical protein CAPTEDRAFT_198178 [Capitella teleta]|eukprot:ELU04722.1 hypothetical protein CAPTEDRAFT_198178 [Capitella teleta]
MICIFSWSSWMDIQGLWTQMPTFVKELPEGWSLPSYFVVLIQCSAVVPLTYGVIARRCSNSGRNQLEVIMVYAIIAVGLLSLTLLFFFWDVTVLVAGQERSLPTLLLFFLLAMVDTTSSVVYLPYMARFKPQYINVYMIGEDTCGFLTGALAMIQKTAEDETCANSSANSTLNSVETSAEPRFSLSAFVAVLVGMMALCMVAFTILHFAPFARKEMVEHDVNEMAKHDAEEAMAEHNYDTVHQGFKGIQTSSHQDISRPDGDRITRLVARRGTTSRERNLIYFYLFWTSFVIFGFFSSIQSFSTLPYGTVAYTLAIKLTCIINPLSSIALFLLPQRSLRIISALIALSSVLVSGHVFLASTSPSPPLRDHIIGKICVVVSTLLLFGALCFCRVSMVAILRGGRRASRALFYAGAAIQSGAFTGGVTSFVLVNVFEVFRRPPPCP